MFLRDFIQDTTSSLFLLPGQNEPFRYSDGTETEQYLYNALAKAKDKSEWSPELRAAVKDWPSRYYLSPTRNNLFRALPYFTKDKHVLELGAGCGALTRFLGENCKAVDAVEGSRQRAAIARQRCLDLENVRVFVSDFLPLELEPKYDIVTLIGVLEYTPLFSDTGEDPRTACLSLLRKIAGSLKNGVLILAIENKLGLKYWTGCGEDHTGRLYDSLYNYPGRKKAPITFDRPELRKLLAEAGFAWQDWYYPFPDYKMPNTIFHPQGRSTQGLYLHNWITTPFEDYLTERKYGIQDDLVLQSLEAADLLWDFSNSFLVLASPEVPTKVQTESWLAKRFATERKPGYTAETTLVPGEKKLITKKRLQPIKEDADAGFYFTPQAQAEWIPGELLSREFVAAIQAPQPQPELNRLFSEYNKFLLETYATGQKDENGFPLLQATALDAVPWNIIVHGKKWVAIDDEWETALPISIDYMLYRSAHYFVWSHKNYLASVGCLQEETSLFVRRLIQMLYPDYTADRDTRNQAQEEKFQEFVRGIRAPMPSAFPKDELVTARAETQRAQNQALEFQALLTEAQGRLRRSEEEFKSQTQQINALLQEMQVMQNSRMWKLVSRYYTWRDKILPQGSHRQKIAAAIKKIILSG